MPSCQARAQLDQHPRHGQLVSVDVQIFFDDGGSQGSNWSRGWPLEGDGKRTLFDEMVQWCSRYNFDYSVLKSEVERALAEAKPYVKDERFAAPAGVEEVEESPPYTNPALERDPAEIKTTDDLPSEIVLAEVKRGETIEIEQPGELVTTQEGVTLDDLDQMRGKK